MQGNVLSGFPAILPSQAILPSCDVIAASAVAIVMYTVGHLNLNMVWYHLFHKKESTLKGGKMLLRVEIPSPFRGDPFSGGWQTSSDLLSSRYMTFT